MIAKCPECGKPLPGESAHDVCPACLMAQAMASRTMFSEDEQPNRAAAAPTPEEVAGHFPQFEITECLGRGGMGVVYKARQKSLDRWVAIKILAPDREREARFAERFAREAQTLARMSHPHIVTIHDFGETDGLYYLVMEFVDGVNLRDLLREGKLVPEQALAIVPPICEALEYAHAKGVIHRDIKPENLLLDRDGRIKIADFGIASLVGASGERSGTPPYMAPEQTGGKSDGRADIYALGVVLYEMLTGERPDTDMVAPSRKVQVDVRLDEIVLRALEKEPGLRYQNAGEFRTVVQTLSGTAQDARYSRMAIAGACWAAFPLVVAVPCLVVLWLVSRDSLPAVKWGALLAQLGFAAILISSVTAPIGATVLGWLAAGRIRRSHGRLRGVGLALFAGLLYPVLFANAAVVLAVQITFGLLGLNSGALPALLCLPLLLAADGWIVWAACRRWTGMTFVASWRVIGLASAFILLAGVGTLGVVASSFWLSSNYTPPANAQTSRAVDSVDLSDGSWHAELEAAFTDYERLLTELREATFEMEMTDFNPGSEALNKERRLIFEKRCQALSQQAERLRQRILVLGSKASKAPESDNLKNQNQTR